MIETQILQELLFGFGLGCIAFLAINLAARLFSRFHPEDLQEIDQLPRQEALECVGNDALFYEARGEVGEHLHSLELQGVNVAPYDAGNVMFNLIADGDSFPDVLGFFSDLVPQGTAKVPF